MALQTFSDVIDSKCKIGVKPRFCSWNCREALKGKKDGSSRKIFS